MKTGTTSIQEFFSLNNHQLEKEGIFFPNLAYIKKKEIMIELLAIGQFLNL